MYKRLMAERIEKSIPYKRRKEYVLLLVGWNR